MKKVVEIIIIALILVGLFFPFYSITVVPDWELIFINKSGNPIGSILIDQLWKDYSLEYWNEGENISSGLESDSNGYIKLPARTIRVSLFGIVSSKIRDLIVRFNPHSSFGPHSYLVCRGENNCVVTYNGENEKPQRVIVR